MRMPHSSIRNGLFTLVSCLVVFLGIWHVAVLFLENVDHPGWDFAMRHGEVVCLTTIHVDPYDIFSESVHNESFRAYKPAYELSENVLDYHWCCGYPPWEYTLLLPFSLLSLQSADMVYKGMELAAIVLLVFFSIRRSRRIETSQWKQILVASSIFLLPPEAWHFLFRYGNWAVLFCAGVGCLVLFLDRGWQILAGLAWAFLMIKPQQGIWFVIPLLLRRQFKTIGVAVATCLAASIPPAVLCGKNPIQLILEIPKMRPEEYLEATLFPSQVFSLVEELTFPKAALFFSAMLCLVFCIWATRKLRKENDWFVFLQPTFFCVCAGYPLWHQDWLYFYFPLLFLLELWAKSNLRSGENILALMLAICLANPPSWLLFDCSSLYLRVNLIPFTEFLSLSTWLLLAYLVFLYQTNSRVYFKVIDETAFAGERATKRHFFLVLVFMAFLFGLVYIAFTKNGRLLGIDDADIFFGYAQNLCGGRGITYANNGLPCEGVTSILWLLICSLCFLFHLKEFGVFGISLIFLVATQWIWAKVLFEVLPSQRKSTFAFFYYAILLLSSAAYVTWMSITLMDLVLWGLLVSFMTLALLRETKPAPLGIRSRILFAIPFALAPWARPESMLLVPSCLLLAILFRRINRLTIRSEFIWGGGGFLLSLAILTGFRMAYFGYPLPNTYYAKVSPSLLYNLREGVVYALGYRQSGVILIVFTLCFCVMLASITARGFRSNLGNRGRVSAIEMLWLWSFALCLPPVLSGGDHFAYFRFFQPVWPLVCILIVSFTSSLWNRIVPLDYVPILTKTIVLTALFVFAFFIGWKKWGNNPIWNGVSPIRHEFSIAETGRQNGFLLSKMFSKSFEKPLLGVIAAGGISRTYQGKIVDLMGLNNTAIAHHPGKRIGVKNHAAFEPDLFDSLHIQLMPFSPDPFWSRTLKGLLETESFVENWRCGRIRKNATGEETPPFFVENGFLDRLLSTGDYSFRDSYRFEDGSWKEIKEPDAID